MQIAFPVWLMAECGMDTLITTNAAGAINPEFKVGDFCAMVDQINFTGQNPLVGISSNLMAERFVPMLNCFDPQLIQLAQDVAAREGISLRTGVYLGLLGPSFETPAEIRMFASWGADTVAMSVVEEVIAARHRGMRVFGMSLLSNMACGVEGGDPASDDIMSVAASSEADFKRLMSGIVAGL
jgi:purine-nucleoside phosphorylase